MPRESNEARLGAVGLVEALDRQVVNRDVVGVAALGEVGRQLGRLQDRLLAGVGRPDNDVGARDVLDVEPDLVLVGGFEA